MENSTIRFPNLGFEVHPGMSITVFGFSIAYYGIIIGIGMLVGALIAYREAKRTGQNIEDYVDFTIYVIIASIVGARLYYVIFEWSYYSAHPVEIITGIRQGGLAIYGGVIAAVITLAIFAKHRKLKFSLMADTACLGLVLGQVIGRWGNFFNREAFGGYSDGLFAMMLPVNVAKGVNADLLAKAVEYNGAKYVQVHPTFLYEGVWNLILFICLMLYRKHKKFDGELFALYLAGYGLGRMWIESLRTDQLLIWNTTIPVSQVLSFLLLLGSSVYLAVNWYRIHKAKMLEKVSESNS